MPWREAFGDGPGAPLLVVHGGPGFPHDYLEPLKALADGRPVVFYDQAGCGRSAGEPGPWTRDRFVEELLEVRRECGDVHVLGHSCGTILALDSYLAEPEGILSLLLVSPFLSVPRVLEDELRLASGLPSDLQVALREGLASGDYGAAFQAADEEFSRRHVFRPKSAPPCMQRSREGWSREVYRAMWGPNQFVCDGGLAGYDRTDALSTIEVPVLYACGHHDKATPNATSSYAARTPGATFAVFMASAHMPHLEEEVAFLDVVRMFLEGP